MDKQELEELLVTLFLCALVLLGYLAVSWLDWQAKEAALQQAAQAQANGSRGGK
ncbi:hypothetical protein [Chitinilyticum litopenaei]|uniref:hypothetical protein n=1 Tax=Chitinilyticum litopenaei TaxID=1121276 RepID=UPI0004269CAE|nr:hypothetical protein [Chitinilyticum litopenaei]